MAETKAVLPPKMSFRQKSLFGIGSAAFGVKDGGFNTFLLLFYSQIVGLPAGLVGLAILIATVVDAFADPFIGAVSDRWRSPMGRRHPFMFAAAVPVAILFFLLWNPPAWSQQALFAYLLTISISLRIAVACYEIPSAALIPELSRDYDERTSILAHRLFYQLIVPAGVYLVSLLTIMRKTPEYSNGMLNPAAYLPYAIFASLIMLASILAASFGTRSRIPYLKTNLGAPRVGIVTMVRDAFRSVMNPSFLLVTVSGIFSGMAAGVAAALATFVGIYFWRFSSNQLALLGLAAVIAAPIAAGLSPFLSRRFGKKRAGIAAAALWMVVSQFSPIMKLLGFLPPAGSNALLAVVFTTTVIGWSLVLTCLILLVSMITDVNEDNELRTGLRSEGVFAAAGSFVNKITSGVGVAVGGLLIQLVHLPAHAKPENVDPATIRELVMINIPVQVVLISITLVLLGMYRIDRKTHEDNLKSLIDAAAVEATVVSAADGRKLG